MSSIDWRLVAATAVGIGLVFGAGVAVDFLGKGGLWALVPTAVGVAIGWAIYRAFGDGEPPADVLD